MAARAIQSVPPLTMNQLDIGVFKIKPVDVKRIVASRPGKRQKGK